MKLKLYPFNSAIKGVFCAFISISFLLGSFADENSQDSLESYLQLAFSASELSDRPTLHHIGIQGYNTDSGFLVSAVLEAYPAFKAGIKRGDIIVEANGKPFHSVNSFANPTSPTATLKVLRAEQKLDLEVTPVYENLYDSYRTATNNSSQTFSAGNKIIGYFRPWALSRNTADIQTFLSLTEEFDYCDGLILDLRGAYGFTDQAHIDAFIANSNKVDHFEKSIVVLVDTSTSTGAVTLAKRISMLQRIILLSAEDVENVTPEFVVEFPFAEVRRNDPQFDGALNQLVGTI